MPGRRSGLERDVAWRLASTEYERFVELLRSLDGQQWTQLTNCPPWDCRAMASHVLGMMKFSASFPESVRQLVKLVARARREQVSPLDAQTAMQVDEHADWSPHRITYAIEAVASKALTGRRRSSRLARQLPVPFRQEPGNEVWSFGFLAETVLTRDVWTHRADIVLATGAHHHLTPDHDGALVADVVAEWAGRHGQPFELTLTGPAGGHWMVGEGGESIELDAVAFWQALAGRRPAPGLLATGAAF